MADGAKRSPSVVFGVLLIINPGVGALALVWIIGAYAIVFAFLLIALGVRLRGMDRSFHQVITETRMMMLKHCAGVRVWNVVRILSKTFLEAGLETKILGRHDEC